MPARPIFEEVAQGASKAQQPVAVGIIDRGQGSRAAIRGWLIVLGLLVAAMVLIGGLTRLTDSGLSITEWKPVTGALPPLSQADWQAEFAAYQQTPQFQHLNNAMTLAQFKFIYWWEWGHRQLGRLIGLVWVGGFLWFLLRRRIPRGWTGRLLLLGLLGGLQGAAGWWMVASGLTGSMVAVASYRLAVHLGLAFLILGFIGWDVLLLGRAEAQLLKARRSVAGGLAIAAGLLLALVGLQVLLGALVAGIDAGRGYTDWPWMAGGFFPPDMWRLSPLWRNFFENDGTVQLTHRLCGYLVLLGAAGLWWNSRRAAESIRTAAAFAFALVLLQVALGVVTVMNSSPLHYAILHQAGAIIVFLAILRARFQTRYPVERGIRG